MTTSASENAISHYLSALGRNYRQRAPLWLIRRALRIGPGNGGILIRPVRSDLVAEVTERESGDFEKAAAGGSIGLLVSYAIGNWNSTDLYGLMQALLDFERNLLSYRGWMPRRKRVAPQIDNSQIATHYDLPWELFSGSIVAHSYSAARLRLNPMSEMGAYETHHRDLVDQLLPSGGHLLDLGCGWGGLAETALKVEGVDVTAVTVSIHQAEAIENRLSRSIAKSRLKVILGDFTNLEILPPQTDAIVMIESIEHLGVPQRAEFFTRLRQRYPSARLAIQATTRSGPAAHGRNSERGALVDLIFPGPGTLPTARLLRRELTAAGYSIERSLDMTSEYVNTALGWMRGFGELAAADSRLAPIARLFEAYASATAASLDRGLAKNILLVCQPLAKA